MSKKAEKAMRKAWKKEARRLAGHDLDGLIELNKELVIKATFWKRVAIVMMVVTGVCLAIGLAAVVQLLG